MRELRVAAKSLFRDRLFSFPVVATLAVAIGANGSVFSLVERVLLRPLPYPEPERLVKIWESHRERSIERNVVSRPNFVDWQEQCGSCSSMAAYFVDAVVLTGDGEPGRVIAATTTSGLFATLGVQRLLGRTFLAEDELPGAASVAVLSHAFWQKRFAGDRAAIGRVFEVDGHRTQVLGVMPPSFEFPEGVDLWLPLVLDPQDLGTRGGRSLEVVARLKPGVSIERAQAEMDNIGRRLAAAYPDSNTGWSANVVPLRSDLVGDVRPVFLLLYGAVTLVLMVACGNVSNLFLARVLARRREMAVRGALGASRWHLSRPLLAELFLLALFAAGLGWLLASATLDLLLALYPGELPRRNEIRIDAQATGYVLLLAASIGGLFGLFATYTASKLELGSVLKEGNRGTSAGGRRLRGLLVVAEVALALVLLIGTGLLVNSYLRLLRVAPGFDPEKLAVLELNLPPGRYADERQQAALMRQLAEGATGLPGVRSAAVISHLPVSGVPGQWNNGFEVEGRPPLAEGVKIRSHLRRATPGYFRTMGMAQLAGRDFTPQDDAGKPNVVIIDEEMRRRYFSGENPLGRRLIIYFGEREPREIVGVVGNVKQADLAEETLPHMYLPFAQAPLPYGKLVVKTESDPKGLFPSLKSLLSRLDPTLPADGMTTMAAHVADSIARRRFDMVLISTFAGVALLLTAMGIYSVIAYHISQKRRELGVRLALGAPPIAVVRRVIAEGLREVAVGLLLGWFVARAASRWLSGLLFEVEAADLPTFFAALLFAFLVALGAIWLSARKVARIDPILSLRAES